MKHFHTRYRARRTLRISFSDTITVIMRRLLTTVTAFSLLLCAATTALWVRSYWVEDKIERTGYLRSTAGHIDIVWLTWKSTRDPTNTANFATRRTKSPGAIFAITERCATAAVPALF